MEARRIELLAPARDLATGLEAIKHGADAVYIGAERFGARAAAGNSVEDIAELCRQARPFGVKVYVTLNTILQDGEVEEARRLMRRLGEVGVDAFIVQDLALTPALTPALSLKGEGASKSPLAPSTSNTDYNTPSPFRERAGVRVHASTQMDNRTAEKVQWLWNLGFEQAVLARELTIDEIAEIHRRVPQMRLEVFVHGAICVSYNGQCYASQYCFGRSANRGECAQFCRLPFDLLDGDGKVLQRGRHLLSLRDMNRSQELEELLDAGVTSLKIEGRLKDVGYVKNVVAWYRQRLDAIFRRRPEYSRSSKGHETFLFEPRPEASFNRGFTNYFLHGRTLDLCNPVTPKSVGEYVGVVKDVVPTAQHGHIVVAGVRPFSNGDGLCYVDGEGRLQGFRVNRVENNKLFLQQMPRDLRPKMRLYRNQDAAFERVLSKPTAERKLPLHWTLRETPTGFALSAQVTGDTAMGCTLSFPYPHEPAKSSQREQIVRQLSRLGDTPFVADGVTLEMSSDWFIPGSVLAEWRRKIVGELFFCQQDIVVGTTKLCCPDNKTLLPRQQKPTKTTQIPLPQRLDYTYNVANRLARHFYERQGAQQVDWAMEVAPQTVGEKPRLMTCRYCIRYQLGLCTKEGHKGGPLFLRSADGRVFRLKFNCQKCQMEVYAE